MNNKILLALIVILISITCLGIVSADNETNETLELAEETIDMTNYIMPTAISGNQITFSDGFTGFCLDLAKDAITSEDGYTVGSESDPALENYIKLSIIECYKQNRENDIESIVTSFVDGSYQSKSDDVISEVLNSDETIGNEAVEEIDNTTEATFTFEHLTSANEDKSDCIAYSVSLRTVETEDVIGASENDTSDEEAVSEDSSENDTIAAEDNNDTVNEDEKTTEPDNNKTNEKEDKTESGNEETIVNETNKTIINKTNTVIVNENNTTIINKTTVKHINNTTDDTPQNDTIKKIIQTVGNPIFLLIVVIAVAAIVAAAMRRKD